MSLPERFRTPRLLLTRFTADDAGALAAVRRDLGVAETPGGGTDEDIEEYARALAAHWDAHDFGWWAVREPGTGRFIGRGGLRYATLGTEREIEVGFSLLPEFRGRGLATELARVAVAQGIVRLGAPALVGITRRDDAAPRRVMEKAGFAYEREIEHSGAPHALYRVTAQSWRMAPLAQRRPAAAEQAVAA